MLWRLHFFFFLERDFRILFQAFFSPKIFNSFLKFWKRKLQNYSVLKYSKFFSKTLPFQTFEISKSGEFGISLVSIILYRNFRNNFTNQLAGTIDKLIKSKLSSIFTFSIRIYFHILCSRNTFSEFRKPQDPLGWKKKKI